MGQRRGERDDRCTHTGRKTESVYLSQGTLGRNMRFNRRRLGHIIRSTMYNSQGGVRQQSNLAV